MSKNLSLKKETLVSLQTIDLDGVYGGLHKTSSAHPGPIAQPTSSAHPGPVAHPTSTVNHPQPVSSVRPTSTAVSSAKPHGGGSLSSVMPHRPVSSVKPNW